MFNTQAKKIGRKDTKDKDIDFEVEVEPPELDGYESLWELALHGGNYSASKVPAHPTGRGCTTHSDRGLLCISLLPRC